MTDRQVAGPGLEPGVAGYEPAVLPLHYPATAYFAPHYIWVLAKQKVASETNFIFEPAETNLRPLLKR